MTDERKYILELSFEDIKDIMAGLEHESQCCSNTATTALKNKDDERYHLSCEKQYLLLALRERIMTAISKQQKENNIKKENAND